jgi:hypothetical protein
LLLEKLGNDMHHIIKDQTKHTYFLSQKGGSIEKAWKSQSKDWQKWSKSGGFW